MTANTGRLRVLLVVILVAAFVLDAAFSANLQVRSARPNIGLTALLVECLFVGPNTGAALGFLLGLLEAAYAAHYVGSLLVSRALAGFAVGVLEERIYRDNLFVCVGVAMLGTAFAEGCFFLFAPQPEVVRWAARTLGECLYNGALALPIYLVVRPRLRNH